MEDTKIIDLYFARSETAIDETTTISISSGTRFVNET